MPYEAGHHWEKSKVGISWNEEKIVGENKAEVRFMFFLYLTPLE